MTVPSSIRSTVKLADLNNLYRELFNHFIVNKNKTDLKPFISKNFISCNKIQPFQIKQKQLVNHSLLYYNFII